MVTSRAGTGIFLALHAICFLPPARAETGRYAIFRSHDRGRTWSRSDGGLPSDARINAFGAIGRSVLAGTDRGIYISRDQGVNWKRASGAATGTGRILTFASLEGLVYAGTDRSGVLVSLDGGVSWAVNAAMPFRHVRALLAHDGALYAGTDAQGVFVSRDNGRSWAPIGQGLPPGGQVFSMAGVRGKVFAGLYSRGLYVWTGEEPSWRKVDHVSPLVLAATGGTLLAGHNPGGIFRSDDFGATWGSAAISFSEDLGKAPVWELASGPGLAVAGVSSRIYHSEDRGRTWTSGRDGLPDGSSGISFLVDSRFVLAAVVVPQGK